MSRRCVGGGRGEEREHLRNIAEPAVSELEELNGGIAATSLFSEALVKGAHLPYEAVCECAVGPLLLSTLLTRAAKHGLLLDSNES